MSSKELRILRGYLMLYSYSLYVQLSRCGSLNGIMLLSKPRERDAMGNTVPDKKAAPERRFEQYSEMTIQGAQTTGPKDIFSQNMDE